MSPTSAMNQALRLCDQIIALAQSTKKMIVISGASGGSGSPSPQQAPILSSMTPSSAQAGAGDLMVTITGVNFTLLTVVFFDATALATTFLSPNSITAVIPAALLTSGGTGAITAQNSAGSSNSLTFTINPATLPLATLSSMSPSSIMQGSGNTTVTLTGTGFTAAAIGFFGGTSLSTSFISPTSMTVVVTAALLASPGTGIITIHNASGTSNGLTFTVTATPPPPPTPTLTSINPHTATAGAGNTLITLTGTSFINPSTAFFGATSLVTTFVSSTSLTATIPSGSLVSTGVTSITVTNTNGTSNGVNFTVNPPPAPTLTTIAPSSAQAGAGNLPVTLTGTGFLNPSTLVFGGHSIATTFGSSTSLTATIPAAFLTNAGSIGVTVTNANGTSNAITFTVTPPLPTPAPTLSTISPSSAQAGANNTAVSLTGQNFTSDAHVIFGGNTLSTTFVSATSLSATIPANLLNAAGSFPVTVQNINGTSNVLVFTVNPSPPPPVPNLTSISPSSAQAGASSFVLSLTGSSFTSDAVVFFGASALSTTFINSTTLTAFVPALAVVSAGTVSITVHQASGVSNGVTFTITAAPPPPAVPTLSSVSPTSVQAGAGNTTVILSGTGFINPTTAFFAATSLTTIFGGSTSVQAVIPSTLLTGAGSFLITVQNANGTSNAITFTVTSPPPPPAPTLTSISPSSAQAGSANLPVSITGTGFSNPTTLNFDGTNLSTTFLGASSLSATIPSSLLLTAGSVSVTVQDAGGTSNALTFTITTVPPPPAPTLTSISPSSVQAGSGATSITLTGTGFINPTTARFNGTALATTFGSSTSLVATIPANLITSAGTASITVQNANGTSGAITFTITAPPPPPAPTLSSVSPSSAQAGSGNLPVTLTGTGFVNPTSLVFGGNTIATSFVSATSLTATIPSGLLANAGTASVTVQNTSGTSNALTFTITQPPPPPPPAPTLTSISPNSIAVGSGNLTITLTGQNFVNPSTAFFGTTALTTTFLNGSSLTAVIPGSLRGSPGTFNVTVQNVNGTSGAVTFTVTPASVVLPAPAFVTPPDNPPLPAGTPVFNAPIGPYTISGAAAIWSDGPFRVAGPGKAISIYGDQFTSDLVFQCCGGDGVLTNAVNMLVDTTNNVAEVVLPSMPAASMYLAWPKNSQGYAEPLVIGRPEARWLACDSTGYQTGPPGDTCYVNGINLSSQGSPAKSWVYLYPAAGGNGQYADASGVNVSVGPYVVGFTIPALPVGNYRVFVHTSRGGSLGWCECAQQLTVALPIPFTSANFPAPIDGGAPSGGDDLAHLQSIANTINASNSGPATISLRAGTYKLSAALTLGGANGINLVGQGAGQTFIKPVTPSGNFGNQAIIDCRGSPNQTNQLQNLTVDITGIVYTPFTVNAVYIPRLVNVNILSPGSNGDPWIFTDGAGWHAYCSGCTLTGPSSFGSGAKSFFAKNTNLILTDGNLESPGFYVWATSGITAINCTCQDQVLGGSTSQTGFGKFIDCVFECYNIYIAGNTTTALDSSNEPGITGEQILFESGGDPLFQANAVSSATVGGATQVNFASLPGLAPAMMFVTGGKGNGQWGRIVSSTSNSLILDRLFRVQLNATSVCVITQGASDFVIYQNNLQGNGDPTTVSTGVETFGGHANGVVDGNLVSNCVFGLVNDSQHSAGSILTPGFHTLWQNNLATNCKNGFRSFSDDHHGMILRNHRATGSSVYDWWIEGTYSGSILDGCTFSDAPIGIHSQSGGSSHVAIYNSTFNLGTGTFAGSKSKDAAGYTFDLFGTSAFVGFQDGVPTGNTFWVAPNGNDNNAGTSASPWQTLQNSVGKLNPGDTLNIRPGSTYAGFILGWDSIPAGPNNDPIGFIAGTATNPITIQKDPAAAPGSVIINARNSKTRYGIDIEPGAGSGTSSTTIVTGTGSKTFTTQAGIPGFGVGMFVTCASNSGTDTMVGNVTAYSGTSLTVNVTYAHGSTSHNSWTINGYTTNYVNISGISVVDSGGITQTTNSGGGIKLCGNHLSLKSCTVSNIVFGLAGIVTDNANFVVMDSNFVVNTGWQGSDTHGHGFYLSGGTNLTVTRNVIQNNQQIGIHVNGDIGSNGPPGQVLNCLIDSNTIFSNAGNAFNLDGLCFSTISNNLVYDYANYGAVFFQGDANTGAINNIIVNNTFVTAQSAAQSAIRLENGSSGNTVLNNILFGGNGVALQVSLTDGSLSGLSSDFNIGGSSTTWFKDEDTGNTQTLAAWRSGHSQDAHSVASSPGATFVNPGANNYQPKLGSPAINTGTGTDAPPFDIIGVARQVGQIDIGCYNTEYPAQVLTSIVLYPQSVTVPANTAQCFTPYPLDQNGQLMATPPAYTFSVQSGGGSINSSGIYTAPASGSPVVKVQSGSVSITSAVTVDTAFTPGINLSGSDLTIKVNGATNNVVTQVVTLNSQQFLSVTVSSTSPPLSLSQQFPLASVGHIYLYGQPAVNVNFTNTAPIDCTVFGGSGTNSLQGGPGNDYVQAGSGGPSQSQSCKGFAGNNTVVGGPGSNSLYGGAGTNLIVPGLGPNQIFPTG